MGQYINEAKRFQKLAKIITESQLSEGYKFDDADEATAKEIEAKIKPAIEGTIKKAMMDIIAQNPELKGAPNYGLAVGNVAYKIVMDSIKENSNTPQSQVSEIAGLEQYKVGMKLQLKGKPDQTFTIQMVQPSTTKGMEASMALHLKNDTTGKEFQDSPGNYEIVNSTSESIDQTIDEALEAHRKQKILRESVDNGEALISKGGIKTGKLAPNGIKKAYTINNGFYGWADEEGRLFTMEVPDNEEYAQDISDYFTANNYDNNSSIPVHGYRHGGVMTMDYNKQK